MNGSVWLLSLLVAAGAQAAAPTVRADRERTVIGSTTPLFFTVRAPTRPRAVASVGSLEALNEVSPGIYSGTYLPPPSGYPQTCTLLFFEEGAAPGDVAVFHLSLSGSTDLVIDTEPDAQVHVDVAGSRFGPVTADARGKARVAIEVPPGVTSAEVLAESRGKKTQRKVAIDAAPPDVPVAALSPPAFDGSGSARLYVSHAGTVDPAALDLVVQGGVAQKQPGTTALGVYTVTPEASADSVSITVNRKPPAGLPVNLEAAVARPDALQAPLPAEVSGTASAPVGPARPRYDLGVSVGPTLAAGNTGWWAGLTFGRRLGFLEQRLHVEAGLGLRATRVISSSLVVGRIETELEAAAVEVGLRGRIYERGRATFYGRLGGGLVPFRHVSRFPAEPDEVREQGLGFEAYAALQAAYRVWKLELLAELRGLVSPLNTARLRADAGGVGFFFGARALLP